MSDATAIVGLVGSAAWSLERSLHVSRWGPARSAPTAGSKAAMAADEERRARSEYVRRRAVHPPRFPGPAEDDDDATSDDGTWGRGHRS